MDCASCATTVEKRVARIPGVHRAVVNFVAGRLDAEHVPGLATEEIENAIETAGFGVRRTEEEDRPPFWRTPRALLTLASALLFTLGLALGLSGAPEVARVGAYALRRRRPNARRDLPKLAEAIRLSRSAKRIIRQNVAASILIKGLFVLFAPFGLVALWLAVLADMGTSIAVTLNGLRLFKRGCARQRRSRPRSHSSTSHSGRGSVGTPLLGSSSCLC
jgi:cation transport ATPase